MNIDNLTPEEIESMEAEILARRKETKNVEQHYGSMEDLSSQKIESMEAEISARRKETKNIGQHYGSLEDLSSQEIESMEAEISARRKETKNVEQHYGSLENLDDTEISIIEAQVAEKRKQDIPYKEYFEELVSNLEKSIDEQAFEDAVTRSMQSNGLMREFVESLKQRLDIKTHMLKSTDINDKNSISEIKNEIEKTVAVYQRYMYSLKEKQWDFNNLHEMKISEETKEELWQQQKRLDISFNMTIPADMGEEYGAKFERDCKMVPGLELMYQNLSGKQVNWHQVMNYRENELTPQQRYRKRLQDQIREKQKIASEKQKQYIELREKEQRGEEYGE